MKNQFRRMTAGILAMVMVISSPISSLAEVKAASPSEATTEYETASPSNASYQDEEALAHGVEKESDAKTPDLTYDADLHMIWNWLHLPMQKKWNSTKVRWWMTLL
mgnify:CR=1 FL=1